MYIRDETSGRMGHYRFIFLKPKKTFVVWSVMSKALIPIEQKQVLFYDDERITLRCRLEASCWNETETARTFLSFELNINGGKFKFYSGSENTENIDHLVIQDGETDKIKKFFSRK